MARRIITISREFGSGGRFIGEEVAKKLGIVYAETDAVKMINDTDKRRRTNYNFYTEQKWDLPFYLLQPGQDWNHNVHIKI